MLTYTMTRNNLKNGQGIILTSPMLADQDQAVNGSQGLLFRIARPAWLISFHPAISVNASLISSDLFKSKPLQVYNSR